MIDAQALFDVLGELYPRELNHALAELRARQAEQRLAEVTQDEGPPESSDSD